jgi:mitogen-activated protein kinase 15
LEREQVAYIIFQLVNSIKQLHSEGVIHRDIRPENILLNTDYVVKIKNFKSAKLPNEFYMDKKDRPTYELYQGRLAYRSPEVILGGYGHTKSMDMWSIGCILGELLLGKKLFTGTTILGQLELIKELLGEPTDQELEAFNAVHKS